MRLRSAGLVQIFEPLDARPARNALGSWSARTAFGLAAFTIQSGAQHGPSVDEFAVQQFVMQHFAARPDHRAPPLSGRTSTPPTRTSDRRRREHPVRDGDLLLLDLWASSTTPTGLLRITRLAYLGDEPPHPMPEVFEVVVGGRDAGNRTVQAMVAARRPYAALRATTGASPDT